LARFLILALLGPIAWYPTPAKAALEGEPVAVLVVVRESPRESQAAQQLLSGAHLALAESDRLTPIAAERVQEAAQNLHLIPPYTPSDLAQLGQAVGAVWTVSGEVKRVTLDEKAGQATAEVALQMVQVASGEWVSRSLVKAQNAPRSGYRGTPEEWVQEATDRATRLAFRELLANLERPPAFVFSADQDRFTVALGPSQRIPKGSELWVRRHGRTIGRAQVTEVSDTQVVAALLEAKPGAQVRSQDEVRVIYIPSPTFQGPADKKAKKSKSSRNWAWVALLALGGIALANHNNGDNNRAGGGGGGAGAPAMPQGLEVRPGDEQVQLFWQENREEDLAGYRVYRSELPDRGFSLVASLPATTTTFTDTGLRNGKTYYYRLSAIDTDQRESERTPVVAVTLQQGGGGGGTGLPPSFPTGLDVQALFDRLVLVWTANPEPDLKEYRVYRALDNVNVPTAAQGAAPYAVVPRQMTTFIDSDVNADHLYFYRVTAVNTADLESAPSVPAQGRPGQPKVQLLGPEAGQMFLPERTVDLEKNQETRTITVQFGWAPVANASRYLFELAADAAITRLITNEFVPAGSTPAFTFTRVIGPFTPIGATVGIEQFYWRVTAVNDDNVVIDQSQVRPVTFDWDG